MVPKIIIFNILPLYIVSLRKSYYCQERAPEENKYQRQIIDTFSSDGKYLARVWSYLMSPEKEELLNAQILPGGFWTGKT